MVTHGRDGWELADYDWDPETGLAKLTYERPIPGTERVEEHVIVKEHPCNPKQQGWRKVN